MSILDLFNNCKKAETWDSYESLQPGDEVIILDPRVEPDKDGNYRQHRHRCPAEVVSVDLETKEITVLFDRQYWKFNWEEYQKSCSENKVQS